MGKLKYQNRNKGRAGAHGEEGRFYMDRNRVKENYKPGKWEEIERRAGTAGERRGAKRETQR